MSMELQQSTGTVTICWAQLSKRPAPKSENRVKVTMMPAATCLRPPLGPFTFTVPLCDLLGRWVLTLLLVDVEQKRRLWPRATEPKLEPIQQSTQGPRDIGATAGPEPGGLQHLEGLCSASHR